ncbi:MAG: branched-chain amino acid ABC transporter permease [Actinobacteria bacterium]|nr:branched-chain amino acid ABC transporter permease [Actinomycetota bacterium]MSY93983.1 branched-chain amino acid ABC transporter permease [Actinomycetota bacterium]
MLVSNFWSLGLDGLVVGAIYALISLGYTLVYGVLRLINFAHSEIFMIGTMTVYLVVLQFGFTGYEDPLPLLKFIGIFLLFATAAGIVSGGSAVLLEIVAYRRLRNMGASRLSSLISAIGASFVLVEVFRIFSDSKNLDFPRLINKDPFLTIGTLYLSADKVLVLVGATIIFLILNRIINHTKLGMGIRAVSQDERTAILMGVNVNKIISYTFLLGGVLAGVGSAFYMVFYETTKANVGFLVGISAFTAAVLGGIGNVKGALYGSFALGLIQQYTSAVLGYNWRDVVTFVILVLVLLIKPTGLFGEALQKARV